ncbi:MAG: tRNA pseudouridine(38-40) synthase TruA [Candidatus Obscuribacterales bacterium]|nr:tRNA pseudouridine(38-40) synthase TruA [Candidatus Obscuribacterales bacterium]
MGKPKSESGEAIIESRSDGSAGLSPASEVRRRIALKLEYDGSKFSGSQMQDAARTVQEDLEKALSSFFRTDRRLVATLSGRTDSGVHARGQVAHFDITDQILDRAFNKHASSKEKVDVQLDQETLRTICWALNGILKEDMSVTAAQEVPNKFHARYSAVRRTYVYRILNRQQRSALGYNAQYFIPTSLNLANMEAAAQHLLGRHDFSAFKSSNSDSSSPICTVDRAELLNYGEGKLEFWISADHFVYNMVRIIVGTLVDIGLGKREPSDLSYALTEKGRHLSGPTAPPRGLCLHQVDYPAEFNLFQRGSQEEPA